MRRGGLRQSSATMPIACVAACMFLIQFLTFAVQLNGGGGFHSKGANSAVATPDKICSDKAGDGGIPVKPIHNHRNCAFCAASDRDPVLSFISVPVKTIVASPPQSDVIFHRLPDTLTRAPTGWISSWSSRAPPSFS